MTRSVRRILLAAITLLLAFPGAAHPAAPAASGVLVATIAAPIGPVTADYLSAVIARAEEEDAALLVVELDTPGGLDSAMRQMVQAILKSRVPVAVYVSPQGARSASAGVLITLAADVAAMAPGTNIGAAHPVNMGGGAMDNTMSRKVENDAAAYARSLAAGRGRNVDWAESAVRESASLSEKDALEKNVVDLVAASLPDLAGDLSPTPGQEAALARIGVAVASGRHAVFVLHGVTGSGKTEVYLRAVEQVRATGRQAVFLVPEIALTPQLLGRVRTRFREGVAVLHSGLTPAERSSQWRKIRDGEVFLCVGARSAVFSPFPSVGLVVVDEEHDAAYKQEDGVRYQARDLALLRGRMEDAVVLLGSATPSAESFHRVRSGAATLLSLPERIGGSGMPEISVVDLKGRMDRRGADRYFSPELEAAIDATLARGEKAMLFLNRRGFAAALTCLECGTTVQCGNCQVALTYHREHEALLCHYCNVKRKEPESCAKCGGHKLAQVGIGTERLLSWVSKRWKEARVARLDSDVTRKRGAYAEVLSGMQRGEVDILVGTQMIAKGHDFPEVTFVGVLLADLSLSFPDFRAAERTFQILTQVAGRAGRGNRPARPSRRAARGSEKLVAHQEDQTMRSFDLSPLYRSTVGFDRMFNLLDSVGGVEASAPTYPPYNIERTGENAYRVTMAVAGFGEDDINIESKENTLTVKGEKKSETEEKQDQFLYRGIAARTFERRFQLADAPGRGGAEIAGGRVGRLGHREHGRGGDRGCLRAGHERGTPSISVTPPTRTARSTAISR